MSLTPIDKGVAFFVFFGAHPVLEPLASATAPPKSGAPGSSSDIMNAGFFLWPPDVTAGRGFVDDDDGATFLAGEAIPPFADSPWIGGGRGFDDDDDAFLAGEAILAFGDSFLLGGGVYPV